MYGENLLSYFSLKNEFLEYIRKLNFSVNVDEIHKKHYPLPHFRERIVFCKKKYKTTLAKKTMTGVK
jgi:hypothetical protein